MWLRYLGSPISKANRDIATRSVDVFTLAASQGMQVRHLRPSVPTLEDVFIDAIEGGTHAHS